MIESQEIKNKRWDDVIAPELERCFITRQGFFRFTAEHLIKWVEDPHLAEKTWGAVLKEARMLCAFFNDDGDHCKGLSIPSVDNVTRIWDRAVVKIIWNIIQHDDPYYDPVDKAFSSFMQAIPIEDAMPTDEVVFTT
jgi:hypothetical protein